MRRPLFILVCILLVNLPIYATDNYPVGARSIALSNAFVSLSDTWSTFHNQAGLAGFPSFSAGVFYESRYLIDELSLAAVSIVAPAKPGTFGFSFSQFGQGTFTERKLGFAYAKKLSPKFHAALQFDYFLQHYPENEKAAGFPTFELGINYQSTEELRLGFHVFNPVKNGFETLYGKQKLPAVFRLGGHYEFSDFTLLSVEMQKSSDLPLVVKTGIEFCPLQNLALRFGISGRPVQYSAGLGYSFGKITTDIAFSYHGNLGFTPSVSLQYHLK